MRWNLLLQDPTTACSGAVQTAKLQENTGAAFKSSTTLEREHGCNCTSAESTLEKGRRLRTNDRHKGMPGTQGTPTVPVMLRIIADGSLVENLQGSSHSLGPLGFRSTEVPTMSCGWPRSFLNEGLAMGEYTQGPNSSI